MLSDPFKRDGCIEAQRSQVTKDIGEDADENFEERAEPGTRTTLSDLISFRWSIPGMPLLALLQHYLERKNRKEKDAKYFKKDKNQSMLTYL